MTELYSKGLVLKSLTPEGAGAAVFSVFDELDLDLDITRRGFFAGTDGRVEQEPWLLPHHLWQSGLPPLGKGLIKEESAGAVFYFKINLSLQAGRDWLEHLRFDLAEGKTPRQQWSYGFKIRDGGASPITLPDGRRGRELHAVASTGEPGAIVAEVSPVTMASQPMSRTLTAKDDLMHLTALILKQDRAITALRSRLEGKAAAHRELQDELQAMRLRQYGRDAQRRQAQEREKWSILGRR